MLAPSRRFASAERLATRRRDAAAFASAERRYLGAPSARVAWLALAGEIRQGAVSHDAHAALGLLRCVMATPRGDAADARTYDAEMVREWLCLWRAHSVLSTHVENST